MILQISNMENGTYEYKFSVFQNQLINTKQVVLDVAFENPIEIIATVEKNETQIYLSEKIKTLHTFSCDRCLDDFAKEINSTNQTIFVLNENEIENNNDEFVFISKDKLEIDLTEGILESLFISIPMKILCKENCLGLCLKCGKNKNVSKCRCKIIQSKENWKQKLLSLKNN